MNENVHNTCRKDRKQLYVVGIFWTCTSPQVLLQAKTLKWFLFGVCNAFFGRLADAFAENYLQGRCKASKK